MDTTKISSSQMSSKQASTKPAPCFLEQIAAEIQQCHKCDLCGGRTNVVVGVGCPHARVMVIGEAPGRNEDLAGEPFVGAAGKLLDELLAEANLKREDIYIANVLKCRPPSNRDPRPEEIEQCADYLRGQTRAIMPDVIVTLGNFATKFILKTDRGITSMRGQMHRAGRFAVFPVFHPAAALYDPTKKETLFSDFRALGRYLEAHGDTAHA